MEDSWSGLRRPFEGVADVAAGGKAQSDRKIDLHDMEALEQRCAAAGIGFAGAGNCVRGRTSRTSVIQNIHYSPRALRVFLQLLKAIEFGCAGQWKSDGNLVIREGEGNGEIG